MSTMNVEIVRPKKSTAQLIGSLLGHIGGIALSGWILMLILGTVTPWHPSYWHSVLIFIAARSLSSGSSGYLNWTKATR